MAGGKYRLITHGRRGGRGARERHAAQLHTMAANLDRRGLTEAMWSKIAELHLARLAPERGLVASTDDPVLCALFRRGVAVFRDTGHTPGRGLWALSDVGVKLAKAGPDGS